MKTIQLVDVRLRVVGEVLESPIYDERNDVLAWIDVTQKRVYWTRYSVSREEAERSCNFVVLPSVLGFIGLTSVPLVYVGAIREGFVKIDLRFIEEYGSDIDADYICRIHTSLRDLEQMRFNDGTIDPRGRILAGSSRMLGETVEPVGNLYQWFQGELKVLEKELWTSNGIGFSPDRKTMYLADSPLFKIWKYDFDIATGKISDRHEFVSFPRGTAAASPDGLEVSSDGCVWVAMWQGSSLKRFSACGDLIEEYVFPARLVTCPSFGGRGLTDLIVTTARRHVDANDHSPDNSDDETDLGGNIFCIRIDTAGQKPGIYDL